MAEPRASAPIAALTINLFMLETYNHSGLGQPGKGNGRDTIVIVIVLVLVLDVSDCDYEHEHGHEHEHDGLAPSCLHPHRRC